MSKKHYATTSRYISTVLIPQLYQRGKSVYEPVPKTCPTCGAAYVHQWHEFCSGRCANQYRRTHNAPAVEKAAA